MQKKDVEPLENSVMWCSMWCFLRNNFGLIYAEPIAGMIHMTFLQSLTGRKSGK